MAEIPTITQIYNNLSNNLKSKLNLSDNDLKKVLDAVAISLAGQFKITYLFVSDVQNNIFPDTADSAENGGTLERHGQIHLNRNRRPNTSGIFNISVTGEIGNVLRSGLTFKSNDDSTNPGELYTLDEEHILTSENDIVEIRSIKGGIDTSLIVTDTLSITEPVIGVDKTVTITEIVEAPLAAESIEDYRSEILKSIQLEPQGGSKTDYRLWAADAQGVRLVYPYVKEGEAGTVQIYVEATTIDSIDGFGTPTQAILDEVAEVIEFDPDVTQLTAERGRRPIQANIEVLPIFINPVDITITGLQEINSEIEDSLTSNLNTYFKSVRPYVAGADLARNKNDIFSAGKLQAVVIDVLDSSNFFTDLTVFINGVAQTSYIFTRENIPYLRNLTFN